MNSTIEMVCNVVSGLIPEPFASNLMAAHAPEIERPGEKIRAEFWQIRRGFGRNREYLTRDGWWIPVEQPLPSSVWYERTAWPCSREAPWEAAHEAAEVCKGATGEYPAGWEEALAAAAEADEAAAAA